MDIFLEKDVHSVVDERQDTHKEQVTRCGLKYKMEKKGSVFCVFPPFVFSLSCSVAVVCLPWLQGFSSKSSVGWGYAGGNQFTPRPPWFDMMRYIVMLYDGMIDYLI